MPFPAATVSFPGIETCLGGEFTLSRGVYPSIATLWLLPQEELNLEPGTLTFQYGGLSIEFPDAAADLAFLRKWPDNNRWRWSLQIMDRRWKWRYGSISGTYNVRFSNGEIPTAYRRTAQELAAILLDALGEINYDVSRVPTTLFPYVNWQGVNPAQALQALCDYVACEVVLGLDNRVAIWPAGVGADAPENSSQRHPRFNLKPRRVPEIIRVLGGPDVYQTKFLLEAIGREAAGNHELIDDLSYAPTWSTESTWSFPSVSDDDDRAAAFETNWRWFRAKQMAQGGLAPQGCPVTVTKISQCFPILPDLIEAYEDLEGVLRTLPPYLEGNFWEYGDTLDNTSSERYLGAWGGMPGLGIVQTAKPVLYLDSTGAFSTPTLYLTAACNVVDGDGQPARLDLQGAAEGVGELLLKRPELFQALRTTYDGTAVTGLVSNTGEVVPEALSYIEAFQQKYADPWSYEMEYAGFHEVAPDGKIAQVKWSCHVQRDPLTHVGVNEEFDVHNLSDKQRRVYGSAG